MKTSKAIKSNTGFYVGNVVDTLSGTIQDEWFDRHNCRNSLAGIRVPVGTEVCGELTSEEHRYLV